MVKCVLFFQPRMIALPSRKNGGILGAMGFGLGPLASRPHTTKGYSWADPSDLACETNLGARIRISSPCREGAGIPRMPSPREVLFNQCYRIDSPEESMHPSMPCHESKVDKRSRGPVFGKYVNLEGRTSLHTRDMRHLLPSIFHLKGRTSLHTRDMCHLPLSIWEKIIHFPRKVDLLPL